LRETGNGQNCYFLYGPSIKIKPRNKIKRLETVNYLYIEGNRKRTKLLLQIFLYGPSIKIKPSIDSSIKIIDPVNKIKSRNGPSIKIKPRNDFRNKIKD
jgi:hypothetical protein